MKRLKEYTVTYENAAGEKHGRLTYAENEDEAVANFYLSIYSKNAKLIGVKEAGQ